MSGIGGDETPSLLARFAASFLDGVTLGLFAGGGRGILGSFLDRRQAEVTTSEERDAVEKTLRH